MNELIDPRRLAVSDFLWDMLPHTLPPVVFQSAQETLGLHPSDIDGLQYQHKESARRFESYAPIKETVDVLGQWAGEAVTEYTFRALQSKGADLNEIPAEMRDIFNKQNAGVIQLGTQAIIMRLLDKGVLKLGDGIGPKQVPNPGGTPQPGGTTNGNQVEDTGRSSWHYGFRS